jgi:hypothetical protein
MRKQLLVSMAVLAAAIATAACEKIPGGETNQNGSVKSEADQPKSAEQPQQRSDQTPSQAAPGQTEQASQSTQAAPGPAGAEQETKSSQAALRRSEQETNSSQAAGGASEQASKSGQAVPEATEQEAKSQAAPGGTEQEGGQQAARAGEDRNAENNSLGQPSQQNRTTGQSDGGTPERTAAQPNQPQQDQAQLPPNPSGQSQQVRDVNLSHERGNAASGPKKLSRDELRQVQMFLKEKGFDVGTVDGVLGPRTRNALLAFQRRQGLEVTGKIDQPTMTALGMSNPAGSTTGQSGGGTQR